MTINDNKFFIDGIYYFNNNTDKTQKNLIYFPVNSTCVNSKLDSVKVNNLLRMQTIAISKKTTNGFFFVLEVDARDSTLYQIKYQQDICCDSVIYTLKSTQTWGKPLSLGIYKLIVPKSVKVKYFSYEPDNKYYFDNFYVYFWQKRDFFPDQDMIFKFKNN